MFVIPYLENLLPHSFRDKVRKTVTLKYYCQLFSSTAKHITLSNYSAANRVSVRVQTLFIFPG